MRKQLLLTCSKCFLTASLCIHLFWLHLCCQLFPHILKFLQKHQLWWLHDRLYFEGITGLQNVHGKHRLWKKTAWIPKIFWIKFIFSFHFSINLLKYHCTLICFIILLLEYFLNFTNRNYADMNIMYVNFFFPSLVLLPKNVRILRVVSSDMSMWHIWPPNDLELLNKFRRTWWCKKFLFPLFNPSSFFKEITLPLEVINHTFYHYFHWFC